MPRPLNDQAVVITGASSGIGRQTALELARHSACVVLAARNEQALRQVADEVTALGGVPHVVPCDVSQWEQVHNLAEQAVERFGRIDTWVNDAAVSEYAAVEQMAIDEIERIIQVDLLGTIYGVKAVLPHMKRQNEGVIINIGSIASVRSLPLQSAYCASKHGIKGFTESLRLELADEKSPIQVTLILPSSINTPFFDHARSHMGSHPKPIPPVYEPKAVAEAIVYAAEHPRRTITVGAAGVLLTAMEHVAPSLLDWFMIQGGRAVKQQQTSAPLSSQDNLFQPGDAHASSRGSFGQDAKPRSLYTRYLELHPNGKRALLAAGLAGAVALAAGIGRRSKQSPHPQ